jgi:signal transduction histidine kinase
MIGANATRDFLMSQLSWTRRDGIAVSDTHNTQNTKPPRSHTKSEATESAETKAARELNMATITHDLSAPLSVIAGAAWSLNDECSEEDRQFWVDCILRNILSAQNMLEDFKDQQRDINGQFEIRLQKIDLSSVVREAVEDFGPLAKDHQLQFYGDAAYILGDAERIKRLVFNLLSNAAKYSQAGREIKVDVWKRGNEVCLFVQDQGRGVEPNEIERMFSPFTRLDADRYAASGDGLGLSSVKRIANAHGASIKVQGTAGQGSIFEVSFKAFDELDQ